MGGREGFLADTVAESLRVGIEPSRLSTSGREGSPIQRGFPAIEGTLEVEESLEHTADDFVDDIELDIDADSVPMMTRFLTAPDGSAEDDG
jgi:hypothetical protein